MTLALAVLVKNIKSAADGNIILNILKNYFLLERRREMTQFFSISGSIKKHARIIFLSVVFGGTLLLMMIASIVSG